MAARKQKHLARIGERAPDFRLHGLDGSESGLRELVSRGPVLLAFFKTTCPVCQMTLPYLDRIWRQRNGAGPVVYGVSQDDHRDTEEFHRHLGLTFPTLLDPPEDNYPVSNAFGISSVPTLFLIEPDGRIGSAVEGFDKAALEKLGALAGVRTFHPGEFVPERKAG